MWVRVAVPAPAIPAPLAPRRVSAPLLAPLLHARRKAEPRSSMVQTPFLVFVVVFVVPKIIAQSASTQSRILAWIIHATSPARMQGRRGEAVWTYCEPRITPQTGWNRRAEGQQG